MSVGVCEKGLGLLRRKAREASEHQLCSLVVDVSASSWKKSICLSPWTVQ